MLAEGFLRLLVYREERKFASNSKQRRLQTSGHCADPSNCARSDSSSAVPGVHSAEAGKKKKPFLRLQTTKHVGTTVPYQCDRQLFCSGVYAVTLYPAAVQFPLTNKLPLFVKCKLTNTHTSTVTGLKWLVVQLIELTPHNKKLFLLIQLSFGSFPGRVCSFWLFIYSLNMFSFRLVCVSFSLREFLLYGGQMSEVRFRKSSTETTRKTQNLLKAVNSQSCKNPKCFRQRIVRQVLIKFQQTNKL